VDATLATGAINPMIAARVSVAIFLALIFFRLFIQAAALALLNNMYVLPFCY
jgi:hypothetical protein